MRSQLASREAPGSPGEGLAPVAVEILSRDCNDPYLVARRAIELRLAGILRMGWRVTGEAERLDAATHEMLARAERREVADDLTNGRRVAAALDALRGAGVRPLVLKGRCLAERLWPRPWMRPAGDLDLLLDRGSLASAMEAFYRAGYRPGSPDAAGRFRPSAWGIELTSADGSVVDVHTRLFRTVGARIAAGDVLARAHETELLGARVLVLDPADEVMFLLVHAAAHGVVRAKWLLDLHAAAIAHGDDVWRIAVERAAVARVTRPFWAAARFLPQHLARRARPGLHVRAMLRRLVVLEGTPARWRRYGLEAVLEESVQARCVRAIGILERRIRPRRLRQTNHSRASVRWIAGAWRGGEARPVRLTVRGFSMAPVLEDGDRIVVSPYAPGERPREGDVVIAERSGLLVAHRVVTLLADHVVTRGDASVERDEPIPIAEILARVVVVER